MRRRDFIRSLVASAVAVQCGRNGTAPDCKPTNVAWPEPIIDAPLPTPKREVWVVNDFQGQQLGTKDNPFNVARTEWDAFMRNLTQDPTPCAVRARGSWLTRAAYEWGPIESPWRLPSGWVLDGGKVSELALDANVPDSYVQSVPLHLICTVENFLTWDKLPRDQAVVGWKFRANYSKLIDRWKAFGCNLVPSGAILQGHSARIEDIVLADFGAWGQEDFPLIIIGAMAGPDRHALSFLDPTTHIFSDGMVPSHISRVKFTEFNPALSNNQISVAVIAGMLGAQNIPSDHWQELPPYTTLLTRSPYICDVEGIVTGSPRDNQVQLATIYQCTDGEIRRVTGENVQCCVYGDYYTTHNLRVNGLRGTNVLRGVCQLLSPTALNMDHSLPASFSSDGLTIENARVTTDRVDVSYHGGVVLDPLAADFGSVRPITNVTVTNSEVDSIKAVDIDGLTVTETSTRELLTVRCKNLQIDPRTVCR